MTVDLHSQRRTRSDALNCGGARGYSLREKPVRRCISRNLVLLIDACTRNGNDMWSNVLFSSIFVDSFLYW